MDDKLGPKAEVRTAFRIGGGIFGLPMMMINPFVGFGVIAMWEIAGRAITHDWESYPHKEIVLWGDSDNTDAITFGEFLQSINSGQSTQAKQESDKKEHAYHRNMARYGKEPYKSASQRWLEERG